MYDSVDGSQVFNIPPCECLTGWGDDYCDRDIDDCAAHPCYSDVYHPENCTEHPPGSNPARTCGPCPDGMSGDGTICVGK